MVCNIFLSQFFWTITATNQKCIYGIQNSRTNDKNGYVKANSSGINYILREILKYLIKIITLLYNLPAYTFEIPDQIFSTIQIMFLVQELFTCIPIAPYLGVYYHLYIVSGLFSPNSDFPKFWFCNFEDFLS